MVRALGPSSPARAPAPVTPDARSPRRSGRLARLGAGTADLFAESPAVRIGWRHVLFAVAAVLAGASVSLLRQPGVGPFDTVWAEDGSIFLTQAVEFGPLRAMTISYAGYYHALPRLLVVPATLVAPSAASVVLAVEAALCTALVALLVYVISAAHLASRLSRLLVSVVVVLVPLDQEDVFNSIANTHWYGLYALFWVLIWTPRGRTGRIVAATVVFLVALSDILTVAFIPLALVRALRRGADGRRDRYGVVLAALLGLGSIVQFGGLLTGSSSRHLSPNPLHTVPGLILRVVPGMLIGHRWLGESPHSARWLALTAVAWLLVATACVLGWVRAVRPAWPLAMAAAAYCVALYSLPVLLTGVAIQRYAVVPAMLVVVALVALLRPGTPPRPAALSALAVLLAVVCAVNLRMDNSRAHGPRWSDKLAEARHSCTDPNASVDVLTPPPDNPPWQAHLPCRYVLR